MNARLARLDWTPRPGHNLGMAAVEVNRLLHKVFNRGISQESIECAIVRSLFSPSGAAGPVDRRVRKERRKR